MKMESCNINQDVLQQVLLHPSWTPWSSPCSCIWSLTCETCCFEFGKKTKQKPSEWEKCCRWFFGKSQSQVWQMRLQPVPEATSCVFLHHSWVSAGSLCLENPAPSWGRTSTAAWRTSTTTASTSSTWPRGASRRSTAWWVWRPSDF